MRSAVVTGGRSGIGAAIVALLEREGAEVRVLDLADGFDVADPAAWETVGPVDLACLNAGVAACTGDVAELADAEYRRVLAANVDGVVLGTRRLARVMDPGSAIVVTASLAGLVPMDADPLYTLTKHAVVGWVRAAAPQLAARGIRLNAVCPGFADTPLLPPGLRGSLTDAGFPLLRADEVAETILLAARSDETGQAWLVQPGREPLAFRFPNVPGARGPAGVTVALPDLASSPASLIRGQ
jgi:NAD(P)-dependent dehydrogenase (short-subunit alcohol dehydrogenase family)